MRTFVNLERHWTFMCIFQNYNSWQSVASFGRTKQLHCNSYSLQFYCSISFPSVAFVLDVERCFKLAQITLFSPTITKTNSTALTHFLIAFLRLYRCFAWLLRAVATSGVPPPGPRAAECYCWGQVSPGGRHWPN